jgi:glycerophosphoryl diester phosphodiesterase
MSMRTGLLLLSGLTLLVWVAGLPQAARAASQGQGILVHGHRGARSVLPENTIPAFEHAIEVGADYLELDLGVTRDDVLVVTHDPVVNRQLCTGEYLGMPFRQLTLEQVRTLDCGSKTLKEFPEQKAAAGARIPTLDEVFALAPKGKFHFNVEIKSFPDRPEYTPAPEPYARMVLEAIRRHKLESRVVVQSFDFRTLHAMKKLAPEIKLAALYSGKQKDLVEIAREGGAPVAAPHYNLVTPEQVKAAHEAGYKVVPWTANSPEVWEKLVNAKVDAIITDHPQALIAWLRERGHRP